MRSNNDLPDDSTIAGISTGVGGGIGIVRISGKDATGILGKIFVSKKSGKAKKFLSHRIYYGNICLGGEVIDEVLVSVMLAPGTYTREDVVEINCHGGARNVGEVLRVVLSQGARAAEPGEFTKRAFLNGRIDLTQAEAVMDLINAKSDLSRRAAVKQLEGILSSKIIGYSDDILRILANIEASIDYPEYEETEVLFGETAFKLEGIINGLNEILKNSENGRIVRDGLETAILGRPNVGKSSLLNAILNEDRAIVTDIPGTTRDVLREEINIHGIPLLAFDTAGIRETSDVIEKMGVERSVLAGENADLVIYVIDGSEGLTGEDERIIRSLSSKKLIIAVNKTDRPSKLDFEKLKTLLAGDKPVIELSAKEKTGLDKLYSCIRDLFISSGFDFENAAVATNARHIHSLKKAILSLEAASEAVRANLFEDFISIDLGNAYNALGEITGRTVDEDLIAKIFSEFCLGK